MEAAARPVASPRPGATAILLAAVVELFGVSTSLPWEIALGVGGAGVGSAVLLRSFSEGRRTDAAIVLFLAVVGTLALAAPDTWLAGLLGGSTVLALLLWLADEPGRVSGGARRAVSTVALAGLAMVVSWASAYLLPHVPVPTGVVGALLVLVVLLATALFARPELLEEEPVLARA